MVPWNFASLRPYVECLRDVEKDRHLYIELEKLANAWGAKRRLSDGRVITDAD